ncbi:NUXm, NADH-ubiquinone oxidoreductase [Exidia glandulosa HHB12029]|uniref:NUXm, NADH-ubiquinone oxidoreductase n=1 Tax=Exidia glandulosa HHB12029 TaxID=1314781 RepID=A0A166BCU8_EXIGL|nr:NUXm, NADH-ubiquinone oxidoreductase [Exidia glandulosa HHB12029]
MSRGPPPYPLIDSDPYAGRVIRYMRPSDFAWWGGITAAAPAALWGLEKSDFTASPPAHHRMAYRVGGVIGFITGFLFAYQRSSMRFWGWDENKREQDLDMKELTELARKGKPLYGMSSESTWIQGVAYRNSQWSQLFFRAVPWFNLVNHPHHGVDVSKYYIAAGVPVPEQKQTQ